MGFIVSKLLAALRRRPLHRREDVQGAGAGAVAGDAQGGSGAAACGAGGLHNDWKVRDRRG